MTIQNTLLFTAVILLFSLSACKKSKNEPAPSDNYTSLANFYSVNGVPMQTYTVNGTTGGSFTTPQGTVVSIPANCFITPGNNPATGTITISFKDIYKKSDMLLSNMPTNFFNGAPLKSGGEFFIQANLGDSALQIAPGNRISITQLVQANQTTDPAMKAMVISLDSLAWYLSQQDTVLINDKNYVYNLYQFGIPASAGTWCNSDNSTYFSAYNQTTITMNGLTNYFGANVFLVFTDVNSMVHVYYNFSNDNYPYQYAPVGLKCTAVAFSVQNGKLYSSFVPITISDNLDVTFSMSETTSADFKAQLNTLN